MLGLAALAMTACNKNDEPVPVANQGNASVSVRVTGSQLRAANTNGETGENQIKTLDVLIFNGDNLEATGSNTNSNEVLNISCSAGEKTIVALANVPSDVSLTGVSLSSLKTLETALKAKFEDANSSNLFMSSEPITVTLNEGKNCLGYSDAATSKVGYKDLGAEFLLTRVNARVDLDKTEVKLVDAYKNKGYEVHPQSLGVILASAKSKFINPVEVGGKFLFGTGLPTSTTGLAAGLDTQNYTADANLIMPYNSEEDLTTVKRFYLFANNSKEHPTILVIAAKLRNKDNTDLTEAQLKEAKAAGWVAETATVSDAMTYFPIRINHEGLGYKLTNTGNKEVIERNHIYELTGLKITRPGVNDPHKDIKAAILDVNCTVAPWNLVTQDVEW